MKWTKQVSSPHELPNKVHHVGYVDVDPRDVALGAPDTPGDEADDGPPVLRGAYQGRSAIALLGEEKGFQAWVGGKDGEFRYGCKAKKEYFYVLRGKNGEFRNRCEAKRRILRNE